MAGRGHSGAVLIIRMTYHARQKDFGPDMHCYCYAIVLICMTVCECVFGMRHENVVIRLDKHSRTTRRTRSSDTSNTHRCRRSPPSHGVARRRAEYGDGPRPSVFPRTCVFAGRKRSSARTDGEYRGTAYETYDDDAFEFIDRRI